MTGPDRCPVCNSAIGFEDEDGEMRCEHGHVLPDALMTALERLKPAAQELVKVIAGLVIVGLEQQEFRQRNTDELVDATAVARELGFHADTIGRWAREGRIRSHQQGGGRTRRYVLAEVIADLYGRGDATE
jgi:hypothetical protein